VLVHHWQASQLSGFSSEQTTFSVSVYSFFGVALDVGATLVFWMRVAGRERR
jgi:hypothetical protein